MTSVAAWSVARSCLVCLTDDLDPPESSQELCLSDDDVGVGNKHFTMPLAECVDGGDIESSSVVPLAGCFDDHVASLALTPTSCVDFENCASALGVSVWAFGQGRARPVTLVDFVDEALLVMKCVDYLKLTSLMTLADFLDGTSLMTSLVDCLDGISLMLVDHVEETVLALCSLSLSAAHHTSAFFRCSRYRPEWRQWSYVTRPPYRHPVLDEQVHAPTSGNHYWRLFLSHLPADFLASVLRHVVPLDCLLEI